MDINICVNFAGMETFFFLTAQHAPANIAVIQPICLFQLVSIDYSMYFSLYPMIHADCGELLTQTVHHVCLYRFTSNC
jgi:hypothetical protein